MTAQLSATRYRAVDSTLTPVGGALMYVKLAGTSQAATIYADAALAVARANPVEADGYGLFPQVFFAAGTYDIIVRRNDAASEALQSVLETNEDWTAEASQTFGGGIEIEGGEVRVARTTNNQTGTTYSFVDGDRGKLVTFNNSNAIAATLPTPSGEDFPFGWYCSAQNRGAGTVTLTVASTIDGATSLTLRQGQGCDIFSTGAGYYTMRGNAGERPEVVKSGGELTISSGAITVTGAGQYRVDTQNDDPTDDLATINGGVDGYTLVLRTAANGRDVTLLHNTGNIFNPIGRNVVLSKIQDHVMLRFDSILDKWVVVFASVGDAAYESAQITLADGYQTYGPFAHGLPGVPRSVQVSIICLEAELAHTVGDEVKPLSPFTDTNSWGLQELFDETFIQLVQGSSGVVILHKGTGAVTEIDYTKWKAIIRATY